METRQQQIVACVAAAGAAVLLSKALNMLAGPPEPSYGNSVSAVPGKKRFQFYVNPMCSFVQRVWIVITELNATEQFAFTPIPVKGELLKAKYFNELPPWASGIGVDSPDSLYKLKDWYSNNVNRPGEVPFLVDHETPGLDIKESEIVAEYINMVLTKGSQSENSLFPNSTYSPEEVTRFRMAVKSFPAPAFYALLRNQDPAKDAELEKAIRVGLGQFVSYMAKEGPFYLGKRFSFADVCAVPFLIRFNILLPYYRNVDVFEPCEQYDAARFRAWFNAASNRPSVKKTSPKEQDVLRFYEGQTHNDQVSIEKGYIGRGRSRKD